MRMRTAYGMIGLGIIVILIGLSISNGRINHRFTPAADTVRQPISSSTNSISMSPTFVLASPEFEDGASIPSKYTCDGDQVNPPLLIGGVPTGAKSLVLIVNDPDVPKALKADGNFDHWVLFNIPPGIKEIASGVTVGTPGSNGAGQSGYAGPCPPAQYEPSEHRYFFKLYALDSELSLPAGATRAEVEKAMEGHVIEKTELVGKYKRT